MEHLTVEKHNYVTTVTLNRVEKRNAMSLSMWQTLGDLYQELETDNDTRVIILTGAGGHFCAGADISEFPTVRHNAEAGERYDVIADACEVAILESSKPTIAAIDGVCVGGGMGLAVCCDFRIASRGARFGITAARLGIIYGLTETRILYDLVGPSSAKRILMTGEIFPVEAAENMGLLQSLVESNALAAAQSFAGKLSDNAPLSVMGAKKIIASLTNGTADQEKQGIEQRVLDAFDSEDYREGQKAFLEKRKPNFKGY